jgi:hypothetical protein
LVDEATNTFGGCRVVSAYGSSEVMMATVCRPEDPVERVASSDGRPVPGVEIRIVGEDGRPAAIGAAGEIRYRGPGRLLEYWRRPDLTAQATDDEGWWCTGDVGRLDEDGYLRVTGRIKDIIVRGGFNISARERTGPRAVAPTGSAPSSYRWTCPASRQPRSRTSAGGAQDADRCTSTVYGYPHLTCSVRRTVASCR